MSLRHPRSRGSGVSVPLRQKATISSRRVDRRIAWSLAHRRTVLERVRFLFVLVSLGSLLRLLPLDHALFLYRDKLVHLFHKFLSLKRLQWNVNVLAMGNPDVHFARRFHGHLLDLPEMHVQRDD